METKHTQGEWKISRNKTTVFNNASDDPCRNFVIAECKQTGINANEQEANAKLISQAVNLLKDAISDVECIEDFVRRFKKGETEQVVYFLENLLISKKAVIKKATN